MTALTHPGTKVDGADPRKVPMDTRIIADEFSTLLSPEEETSFQAWAAENKSKGIIHPMDSGHDYDMRGAWKAGEVPTKPGEHWVDTHKKPWHETFSNESKFATGENAKYAGR